MQAQTFDTYKFLPLRYERKRNEAKKFSIDLCLSSDNQHNTGGRPKQR